MMSSISQSTNQQFIDKMRILYKGDALVGETCDRLEKAQAEVVTLRLERKVASSKEQDHD